MSLTDKYGTLRTLEEQRAFEEGYALAFQVKEIDAASEFCAIRWYYIGVGVILASCFWGAVWSLLRWF